jgi:hypothetical protein
MTEAAPLPPLPPRPEPPAPGDCCGSDCVLCVYTRYERELEAWEQAVAARRGQENATHPDR